MLVLLSSIKVQFYSFIHMVDLLTALIWLHYEAAPVVDSATQRLLEENNQFLNQIAANIEIFKVCI